MLKEVITYYNEEKKNVKEIYTVDEKGVKQGCFESFYPNGQVEMRCAFKDGKKHGRLTKFWENGQTMLVCIFEDGNFNGRLIEFNQLGWVKRKGFYLNNYYKSELDARADRADVNTRLKNTPGSVWAKAHNDDVRILVAKFCTKYREQDAGRVRS